MFKVLPPGLMGGQRRDGRGGKLGRQTERQGWDRGGGGGQKGNRVRQMGDRVGREGGQGRDRGGDRRGTWGNGEDRGSEDETEGLYAYASIDLHMTICTRSNSCYIRMYCSVIAHAAAAATLYAIPNAPDL